MIYGAVWAVANATVSEYRGAAAKLRGGPDGDQANRNAAHIAANDPATVIRHCERDLKVLERHPGDRVYCPGCGFGPPYAKDGTEYRSHSRDCPEIADLATAYGITEEDPNGL